MEVKALACGLLEDNGRALFLLVKDPQGVERLTLPLVIVESGDPVALLAEGFLEQTGIDGEVKETVFETKWNAGSRKRKRLVPCLVFKIVSKAAKCKPSKEFTGFKWLSLNDALTKKLDKRIDWLKFI